MSLAPKPAPSADDFQAAHERAIELFKSGDAEAAYRTVTEALARGKPAPDLNIKMLRNSVAYAQGMRRPPETLKAAQALRAALNWEAVKGAQVDNAIAETALLEAEMAMMLRDPQRAIAATRDALALRNKAYQAKPTPGTRAPLLDAYVAMARHGAASNQEAIAQDAIRAAEPLLSAENRNDPATQQRRSMLTRIRITLAQRAGRHAEAAAALNDALDQLGPSKEMDGEKLQILTRLARSHLALGDDAAAMAAIANAEAILPNLSGLPERAEATLKSGLLGLRGEAELALGERVSAREHFGTALALLKPHEGPDLDLVRQQIATPFAKLLREDGEEAAAEALLADLPKPSGQAHHHHGPGGHAAHNHSHR
jgi:hypothetical protein